MEAISTPTQRHTGRKKLIAHVLAVEAETGVSIRACYPWLEQAFDDAVTASDERVARNVAAVIEKHLVVPSPEKKPAQPREAGGVVCPL